MFEYFGPAVRKLSLVVVAVGLLVAFFTEAFSDVRAGKSGRPKPPIVEQRTAYLLLIGSGVPGLVWGLVRTARGRQSSPWD